MHDGAPPPTEWSQEETPRDIRNFFGGQRQTSEASEGNIVDVPVQEHLPAEPTKITKNEPPRPGPRKGEISSDEDAMTPVRRRTHSPPQKAPSTSLRKSAHGSTMSISEARGHRKPGPKPWAAKPIAKNDMKAKMEIIREIEKNWGKGFILNYIPKCHRPLQKKKGGKRTAYRVHETDPKKWLPSVLKAVLMVSNLTNDKAFLKKAFNDIVRHRIKHTGNRKPQLVTTDFDIIEDMIVRGWDIDTSFTVRYKHLLMANPKGYTETDEDIDHILNCGEEDYVRTSDHEGEDRDEDEEMEVDAEGQDEDNDNRSSPYKSSFIYGAPHQQPKMIIAKEAKSTKHIKKEKQSSPVKKEKRTELPHRPATEPSPPQMPPNPYAPYGIPGYPPYGAYPGYPPMPTYPPPKSSNSNAPGYPHYSPPHWPGYPPYPGYPQNPMARGNKDTNMQDLRASPYPYPPPGYPGMPPYPQLMSPSPTLNRTSSPSSTDRARFSPFRSSKSKRSSEHQSGARAGSSRYDTSGYPVRPRIKREPDVEEQTVEMDDVRENSGVPDSYIGQDGDEDEDDDEEEQQRMQEEIAQQERRVQMLKAKLARRRGD